MVATVRHHVVIAAPAAEVWEVAGDPAAMDRWFPVTAVEVDGDQRRVTLRSGIVLTERIVTLLPRLRRFQYTVTGPLPLGHHLGTVDVCELDDDTCVVVYGTDVEPPAYAPVLSGVTADALGRLAGLFGGGVVR